MVIFRKIPALLEFDDSDDNSLVFEIFAYEFKWNPRQAEKARCPDKFRKAYPAATFLVVTKDNYVDFVAART